MFVVHAQNRYRDQRRKAMYLEAMRKNNSSLTEEAARADTTFQQVDNLARAEAMGARRNREKARESLTRVGK